MTSPRLRNRFLSVLAAAAVLVGVAGQAPASAAPKPTAGFAKVATHSWAQAQPTATGQAIVSLEAANGKVYAGYGDYGSNTGPITIAGFQPAAGAFVAEHVQDTEAVYNFRSVGTTVISPSIDPRVGADYAQGAPWVDETKVGATHVFDTATLGGADRWLVGSSGIDAVAWRSSDAGATWTEALRVGPTQAGDFARFYFAGVLNGKLYVQATDYYGAAHPASNVFTGTSSTWSAGPALITAYDLGHRPEAFAGKLWFHTRGHGELASIKSFDGTVVTDQGTGYSLDVSEDRLLILDGASQVKSTTDGRRWTTIGTAPATARSVTFLAGKTYVGTTTSEVWAK